METRGAACEAGETASGRAQEIVLLIGLALTGVMALVSLPLRSPKAPAVSPPRRVAPVRTGPSRAS